MTDDYGYPSQIALETVNVGFCVLLTMVLLFGLVTLSPVTLL